MNAHALTIYLQESQKHNGILLYEWLLEFAYKNKIPGGSAFRAISGFGRHGTIHSEHFFELASDVSVAVVFIIDKEKAQNFITQLQEKQLNIFYTLTEVECGYLS